MAVAKTDHDLREGADGGSIGFNNEFRPTADTAILSTLLEDLDFTVRTQNVLKNANVRSLGDLARLNEEWLLRRPNCGRKTISELRENLRAYGLSFGTNIAKWRPPAHLPCVLLGISRIGSLTDFDITTRAILYLRIIELELSSRTTNALTHGGIEFVGDLIQISVQQLLRFQGCGQATLAEIKKSLGRIGLTLDTPIVDWSSAAAKAVRDAQEQDTRSSIGLHRRKGVVIENAKCLEDELGGILGAVVKGRNAEIALKLFGWNGSGRRTLESVGCEYGLTRERIRQIVQRVLEKLRKRHIETPFLNQALSEAKECCPAAAATIAEALKARGIAETAFNVTGLESACDAFGKDIGIMDVAVGGKRFYVRQSCENKTARFFQTCRRLTSSGGCANFEALCDDLRISQKERSSFAKLVTCEGLAEWLDNEQHWLFSPAQSRNRLWNIVAKVLSVSPELSLADLRRAVARSRRLSSIPPAAVLARFVERLGLATVSGERVRATTGLPNAIEPGSAEDKLVAALRKHGPVLGWDRLQKWCVEAGMNPITFGIYLSSSPVVARLCKGVYSLVGADVLPGEAEDAANKLKENRKPAEWGWSAQGTLWCAVCLSSPVLASGAISIPAFVADLTEGEWQTRIGRSLTDIPTKSRNRFVWSVKRALSNLGAEPGDVCILEFDLAKRILSVTIGGDDLLDAWQRGDSEPVSAELVDSNECQNPAQSLPE